MLFDFFWTILQAALTAFFVFIMFELSARSNNRQLSKPNTEVENDSSEDNSIEEEPIGDFMTDYLNSLGKDYFSKKMHINFDFNESNKAVLNINKDDLELMKPSDLHLFFIKLINYGQLKVTLKLSIPNKMDYVVTKESTDKKGMINSIIIVMDIIKELEKEQLEKGFRDTMGMMAPMLSQFKNVDNYADIFDVNESQGPTVGEVTELEKEMNQLISAD